MSVTNPYVRTTQEYKSGVEIGKAIACAAKGMDLAEYNAKEAFVREASTNLEAQRIIASTGAWIFERGGMAGTPEHTAMCKLAAMDSPVTEYTANVFLAPVVQSISHYRNVFEERLEKSAAGPGLAATAIPSFVGKTFGSLPAVVKMLALLGIGGGLAGGGLSWALNRSATQDDADIAAKEEQAAHYRQIAKDIQRRIKLEESKDKKVKEIAEAAGAVAAENGSYVV